jgi:hypothetical protein
MTNPINLLRNKIDHIRYWLVLYFEPVDTLMDIGCGNHPVDFMEVTGRHYTVDPEKNPGEKYWHINGTWQYPAMNFIKSSLIHTVTLMDVVEHLEKAEAQHLLKETQKHVKQIVVFTPLGFMEQEDGTWNSHRSGWMPEDFGEGWTVQVFPHFHWCDFKGRVFPEPKGAILAVWRKAL